MIYFIQSGGTDGPIKIGYTAFDDALVRLKSLQVGNPNELVLLGVMEGSKGGERGLHRRFHSQFLRGEWFSCSDELRAFVADNAISVPPVEIVDQPKRELPPTEVLRSIIRCEGSRMYWRERQTIDFNRRYAGREISGKTVRIDGYDFKPDEVLRKLNNAA